MRALVTGSSSGFGELISKTLAAAGHHVYATMRDVGGRNADAAERLRSFGTEVVELDVTSDASVERAMAAILPSGGIDVVILEPGSFPTPATFKSMPAADQEIAAAYASSSNGPLRSPDRKGAPEPDPQEIADAVLGLVNMPPGQRPLRLVIGPVFTDGVAEYNATYERLRAHMEDILRRPDQAITWTPSASR